MIANLFSSSRSPFGSLIQTEQQKCLLHPLLLATFLMSLKLLLMTLANSLRLLRFSLGAYDERLWGDSNNQIQDTRYNNSSFNLINMSLQVSIFRNMTLELGLTLT